MVKGTCAVDTCGNPSRYSAGMCAMHYARSRAGVPLERPSRPYTKQQGPCAVPECGKQAIKRGWCESHYKQAKGGREPSPIKGRARRLCVICGAQDWEPNGRRTVCSDKCRAQRDKWGGPPPDQKPCSRCGDTIDMTGRRRNTLYCEPCREARHHRHKMSTAVIAKRDGTDCSICGKPIDMGLKYPDLYRASVDHVLPHAKGGPDHLGNLALAHLRCNLIKATRVGFSLKAA